MLPLCSIAMMGLLASCRASPAFVPSQSPSFWAYETGLQLGWLSGGSPLLQSGGANSGDGADQTNGLVEKAQEPNESSCVDLISLELEEELEQIASSTGFRLSDQMLAPLSNQSHLEAVCKVFEGKMRSLEECQIGSNQVQNEGWDTAVLTAMKLICVKYTRVLKRSSACLSDTEKSSHWECVDACRETPSTAQQSSSPAAKIASVNDSASSTQPDDDGVECEDDGNNKLKDLYDFYYEIAGAQILYGLEMAQQQIGGDVRFLFDSKKLPAGCQLLMENSVQSASVSSVNKKLMHGSVGKSSPMIDEV